MKKVKVKRRPTLLMYGIITLMISFSVYMGSSIYLKQYNNQISVAIQTTEAEIKSLSSEKEALQVEIDKLATKNKVVDVAVDEDDMSVKKENIVYITKKDE